MSDTQTVPVQRPGSFRIFISRARAAIGIMSWIFPIFFMAGGWYFFPPLRAPITLANLASTSSDVFFGLFIMLALVVVWFFYEVWYAVSRKTSVLQLQVDGVISTIFAIVFTYFGATLINQGALPWWYVLPWVGTVADAVASSFLAVNNAAQKPIVQSDPRGA